MNGLHILLPAFVAGLAVGILWADRGGAQPGPVAALAALIAALVCLGGRRAVAPGLACALLGAGVALGAWRGTEVAPPPGAMPLAELAGGSTVLSGTLADDPRPRGERLQLVLDHLELRETGHAVHGRLLVWTLRGPALRIGDRLEIEARIDQPEDFDGFAYRDFLARRGITAIARTQQVSVIGRDLGLLPSVTAEARSALLSGLNRLVPEPEASIGAGLVLGVRAGIPEEISDAFASAGLSHIVAISGFHIALVAGVVMLMVEPLRRRPGGRWLAAGITVIAVVWYVLLTGTRPSAVRAALMATAVIAAQLSGSRAHAGSALLLAAALMLLTAPDVLWDIGFQLSLLATAGIVLAAVPIADRLPGWPPLIRGPVALTMAAQLTTLPVLLMSFERLSLVAPLANVLAVPLVPLAMAASVLAALAGAVDQLVSLPLVGELLSWLAGGAAWLYLRLLIAVAVGCAQLPYAAIDVGMPPALAVGYFVALAAVLTVVRRHATAGTQPDAALGPAATLHPAQLHTLLESRTDTARATPAAGLAVHRRRGGVRVVRRLLGPAGLIGVTVAVLGVITLATAPDGRLHLSVLDIGQGDALLIEAPSGALAVVDGGPDPDLTLRRLGEELPFTRRQVALVMLSHPHQDHVAGLVEILARFRVGTVLEPDRPYENAAYDRFLADARSQGILVTARAGQTIPIDATTTLEILFPSEDDARRPLPDGDINNASVVALLRHGSFTALLTGDAEAPVEAFLLQRGLVEPVDVLKVGHHGSDSSTTPRFLAALNPAVAVMSLGADNRHGHPSPRTLETLAAQPGIEVYRTDLDGTVTISSEGSRYVVRAAGRPELRLPARGATPQPRTGSIGAWPFPTSSTPGGSSTPSPCRTASSSIPRACGAWRRPPPAWSPSEA